MSEAPAGTKDRLLQAAMELFYAQGYAATGMAQILREAGVNSGSLYHFFRSKEDLLLGVLDRYREMLWPVLLQPIWDAHADPIDRVFGLLEAYRKGLLYTECTRGCPIGNLALELNEFHPEAHEKIAMNFTGWREAIEGCLAAAADRFPPGMDLAQLSSFVLTVMEGGIMQARSYRSVEPFDASVALLRDYFDRLMADAKRELPAPNEQGEDR